MSKLYGGKNPFDDPFFTEPFGGFFGGNPFDDPFFTRPFADQLGSRKQITIEELDHDDDGAKTSDTGKELIVRKPNESAGGASSSILFRRVAYGDLGGMYYTCSEGRMTGGDGVFFAEMKEEDNVIGESLHTISKGIHNKGHSLTTKNRSGRVDSMQTLHNLNEDELSSFEEDWKSTADKHLPGWSNGSTLLDNAGANWIGWDGLPTWNGWGGWALPSVENFGNVGALAPNGEQKAKRVVPVNIE